MVLGELRYPRRGALSRLHGGDSATRGHTRFNGRLRAVKSAVRALYAANAGPRASHSYNVHARCMDSRDIDGGARWDASPAVKVPPQGSKGQPLEMGSFGR